VPRLYESGSFAMALAVIRRPGLYGGLCSIPGLSLCAIRVRKVALGYNFSPSISVFRSRYHSICATCMENTIAFVSVPARITL